MRHYHYLRQLSTPEVWRENTRAMLSGDTDGVEDSAIVLLSRTDMSPQAFERSRRECEQRGAIFRRKHPLPGSEVPA